MRRRGTSSRPPVDVMKHTSWLSGLAAVRRPSSAASAPHLRPCRWRRPGTACGPASRLVEHVHDVALVLGRVGAALERAARRRRRADPGVVAGGDGVEAEQVGPLGEPGELDVAVALDARVRRDAGGVGRDVRARRRAASKSSPKLNTRWSMSSCWATRRASSTSVTQQQPVSLSPPHSFIVTPTTSWPSPASSSARRPTSRRRRSSRPSPSRASPTAAVRARSLATPTAIAVDRASTSASVVVRPSVRRSAPAASAGRRPSPPARATAPSRRSRRPTPPTRTPRPRRAGTAATRSRCPSMQHVGRAGDLAVGGHRLDARRRARLDEPVDEAVAQRGDAGSSSASRSASVSRQRRRPWRRCRRRCGCRCAARAPGRRRCMQRRRAPAPSRIDRARRRPSGRRTCGR